MGELFVFDVVYVVFYHVFDLSLTYIHLMAPILIHFSEMKYHSTVQ